jgi:hypothetical protein
MIGLSTSQMPQLLHKMMILVYGEMNFQLKCLRIIKLAFQKQAIMMRRHGALFHIKKKYVMQFNNGICSVSILLYLYVASI